MPKRKPDHHADALKAAAERVKECELRLEQAKLLGVLTEIASKREKLAIARRKYDKAIRVAAKAAAKSARDKRRPVS